MDTTPPTIVSMTTSAFHETVVFPLKVPSLVT
nr:MAG TPA: hypothetical protein [Caudoviricetes sp.]